MAKSDASGGAQVADVADPAVPHMTLDEFCLRMSKDDGRVELIHGFAFTEKQAGRFKDAESNFQARLEAFANKPV